MKEGFLHKLIEKLDRVEPGEVQAYLARLLQEKGFFERVFDALQEGVVVMDGDGIITYLNRAAGRLFGLDEQEAVGDGLGVRIRGLDWEALVREGKVISRDLEVFYPENRFLNFYLAPIEGDADEQPDQGAGAGGAARAAILGYVMIVRDITREREVEQEKIESEKLSALTMLAAGVAHEIGNPLNSLNIHLQLAGRKLAKAPPDVRDGVDALLEVAQGEIKRLDFIVAQFLDAIRPREPRLEMVDPGLLVQEALKFLAPEIEDRGIEIISETEGAIPSMPMDPDQIKQAIYNLVKNAAQAIGHEGTIRVTTSVDDDHIILQIADDGVGMSAQDMGSLFEPFRTSKPSGTGLGLLIVRRIVREHGGEVEFESSEGGGTTVRLLFPLLERRVRLLPPGRDSDGGAPIPPEEAAVVVAKKRRRPKPAKGRVVE